MSATTTTANRAQTPKTRTTPPRLMYFLTQSHAVLTQSLTQSSHYVSTLSRNARNRLLPFAHARVYARTPAPAPACTHARRRTHACARGVFYRVHCVRVLRRNDLIA